MTKGQDQYAGQGLNGADYTESISWDEVGNPPPQGDYNFICEKAEYKPTSTGKHMVKVQLKIEAACDPNHESAIGRTVFTNFNFFQQGAFVVKAYCKALEIPLPPQVNKAILEDWAAQYLVGSICGATLKHRTYQDALQADLSGFKAPFDVSGQAIDSSGGGDDAGAGDDAGDAGAEAGDEGQELEAGAEEEEESEDAEPETPPPAPTRSLRTAAPAPAAKANGHTNGHANGKTTKPAPAASAAPKGAPPKAAPAKKSAVQARR